MTGVDREFLPALYMHAVEEKSGLLVVGTHLRERAATPMPWWTNNRLQPAVNRRLFVWIFLSFGCCCQCCANTHTHIHTRLPLFLFQLSISTMIFPFFFFDSLSFFDDWKWQHNSSYCLDDGRKWNATQDIHHFRRPELAAYWPYTTIEMVFFSRLHLSLFFISFSHLPNDKQMPIDFHLDLFFCLSVIVSFVCLPFLRYVR